MLDNFHARIYQILVHFEYYAMDFKEHPPGSLQ